MPKVVREDVDNLNSVLTVTLEKKDYEPKYVSELDKYRKQAQMKGFRKGKTPISVIKKMYGKAVLADVINELLQEELNNHLTNEKLDILGQPIPAETQEKIDFDLKDLQDYEFKFDLGLAPKFDIKGIDADDVYEFYKVNITDDMINEDLEAGLQRTGERINPEDDIQEKDFIRLEGTELENGQPKEDGLVKEISVLVERLNDKLKADILSKKLGDRFVDNVFKLEKDTTESYVRKNLLQLEESDEREVNDEFDFEITEVSRVVPAELNQEFFDKFFGEGVVSSEAEAREKTKEHIQKHFDNQADALLFRDFQERLLEENVLEFPKEFLKRWMLVANENATAELIESEYDSFQKNLQWTLIRSKLIKEFDLDVKEEELREGFANQIMGYLGNSPYATHDLVQSMVERSMSDENSLRRMYDEMMTDKLHTVIKDKVTVNDKVIEVEAFKEIAQQARDAAESERNKVVLEEE
ncbi:MAG: trigger factor [Saprospiraceae bacterium]|nr:MAG: trigger factor [Saprospiraceae bacterium]